MTSAPEKSASISELKEKSLHISNLLLDTLRRLEELAAETRSYELVVAAKDADLEKALTTLEFYADQDSHKPRGAQPSLVSEDNGYRAREALADLEA